VKPYRVARVAEAIREVASETILFELKDPRVRHVTVTRVEVSADLQHARIYVSVMGSEREQKLCLQGLRRAAGFVQRRIGQQLRMRYTPEITFVLDQGVKKSIEISRLLDQLRSQSDRSPQTITEESGPAQTSCADEDDAADQE